MCGYCGSMPPWAPEALKEASPAARRALFERMKEKQRRFIVERDARLADMKLKENADAKEEKEEDRREARTGKADEEIERNLQSGDAIPLADDIPLQIGTTSEEPEGASDVYGDISEAFSVPRAAPVTFASSQSSPSSSLTPPIGDTSPKRKPSRRAVVIDPNPERTAQRANNPRLSSASFRSNDSDADSFHTAEEVDRSVVEDVAAGLDEVRIDDDDDDVDDDDDDVDDDGVDDDGLQEVPIGEEEEADDEFADWQAFAGGNQGSAEASATSEAGAFSLDGNAKDNEEATTEIQLQDNPTNGTEQSSGDSSSGPIPTLSMLQLSPGASLTSIPSENLEESVSARRPLARGHARQNSASQFEEYALPSDIVPLRAADVAPPLQCEDCEKWRTRVEELQLKVEALTSALAARDMEGASLRAKCAGKMREPNRSESRLIQECESLRVTTEFLYQKLERYERKAHIGVGDVH